MSDVLAIVGAADSNETLLEQIAYVHPTRVTVLLEPAPADSGPDDSPRARALRQLLAGIERRTGAAVVGLAGSRDQLRGWRFDRVVGSSTATPTPAG